jgi:hypothetical protein
MNRYAADSKEAPGTAGRQRLLRRLTVQGEMPKENYRIIGTTMRGMKEAVSPLFG